MVGEQQQVFNVHEDLICARIPFFRAAFKGEFREAQEGQLKLPEEKPEAFRQVLKWVYSGQVGQIEPADLDSGSALLEAYILANAWCLEELKNQIIDRFKSQDWKSSHLVAVFRGTALPDCELRGFFIDRLRAAFQVEEPQCSGTELGEYLEAGGAEVRDLVVALFEHREAGYDEVDWYGCKYHEHKTSKTCESWKLLFTGIPKRLCELCGGQLECKHCGAILVPDRKCDQDFFDEFVSRIKYGQLDMEAGYEALRGCHLR